MAGVPAGMAAMSAFGSLTTLGAAFASANQVKQKQQQNDMPQQLAGNGSENRQQDLMSAYCNGE
jgi:hypothetical protein